MIEALIRRAQRRLILNEALAQLAFAGAFAIAGLALILLLGTRFLAWWTLALFAASGILIGILRLWRSTPDDYSTAVRLDQSAQLSDAVSTAFYFSKHHTASAECAHAQRTQAEDVARGVHLDQAFAFTFPRSLYILAGLAVLTSVIFAIRFAGHGLDLRPPLTEVLFEDLAAKQSLKKQQVANTADRKRLETAESLLAKLGVPIKPEDQKQDAAALDKAIDQALEGAPGSNEKGQKGPEAGKSGDGKAGNGMEKAPNGDPLDGKPTDGSPPGDDGKTASGKDGAAGDKGNSKNPSGDNSSLLSKLKDAVSNMLSKAKQDNSAAGQKGQQQQGQTAKAEKGSGEKNSAGKGQDQGQSDSDAQDGEASSEAQQGQQAQGKAGSKSSQQSAQSGSGVGSQDGAKDLKAAEQLKAMGKISEILGKRAATVTGETTIEVESGNQQLRTAYSKTAAGHGESDGDVNRDEIPVALQPYVQQYFEQVRKSASVAKAAPAANRGRAN